MNNINPSEHSNWNKLNTLIPLVAIVIANIIFAYLKFIKGDNHFYQEHELLEDLQAVLLAISGIVCLTYSAFLEKRSALIVLSFSLLCLSFFLREVNVEDFELPAFLVYIGAGIRRNILITVLWGIIALIMALDFRNMKQLIGYYLLSRSGILVLLCGSLLIASDIFERWFKEAINSEFFEEILEFNAYYFLFWSALISRSSLQSIQSRFNGKT